MAIVHDIAEGIQHFRLLELDLYGDCVGHVHAVGGLC
jgi:hypothetical protein